MTPARWYRHLIRWLRPGERSRPRDKRSRPPRLEQLEDRMMPTSIVWVNRLSSTDRFTPAERAVVDQAIARWQQITEEIGLPTSQFDLTVVGGSRSHLNLGPHVLADTQEVLVQSPVLVGPNGTSQTTMTPPPPHAATIRISANAAGIGWYVDPHPEDNSEFKQRLGPSRFRKGPRGIDLYSVVLHEMGHALGFNSTVQWESHLTRGPGRRWTYHGQGFTAVFDPDGVHLSATAYPGDLMTAKIAARERQLPSALDLRLLADAYGRPA